VISKTGTDKSTCGY